MNFSRTSLVIGAALTAGSFAASQSDPLLPAGGSDPVVEASHGAILRGDEVVGGGRDYKVRFDSDGMEYVPALGSAHPSMPFAFEVESIRRGDTVLHGVTGSRPTLADGDVACFDCGNGIVERFDVEANGVELSYVFPHRLPGSGDLVVRAKVRTELEAAPGVHDDGVTFWKKGVGGVSFGDVTGIDAIGDCHDGWLRWDGEYLDLVLPAEFVDNARYPMVLDPLIGSTFDVNPHQTDWNDIRADAAFDMSGDNYLVVWQRKFGVNDTDIRGQLVGSDGTLIGGLILIESATQVALNPCVANITDVDTFVVAYQTAPTEFGPFDIECKGVSALTGATSIPVTIANSSGNEIDPDASGERVSSPAFRNAIVVWSHEGSGIECASVHVGNHGAIPVPSAPLSLSTGVSDEVPAISKSGGDAGRHCVVWQRSGHHLRARLIGRNLAPLGTQLDLGSNARKPDVDGDGDEFMIGFERWETPLSGPRDIYCQMVRWNVNDLVPDTAALPIEAEVGDDEFDIAVGFLGPKYVVAWSDAFTGFLQSNIQLRALGADCEFCGTSASFGTGTYDIEPQVASRWAAGDNSDECLIVNSAVSINSLFDGSVRARLFEAVGQGGPVVSPDSGCGFGGVASISGAFAIANNVSIQLAGAQSSVVVLHVGAVGAAFSCGPCTITNPFLAIPIEINGGSGSFTLGMSCSAFDLVGAQFEMQFVSGFTPATPCTFAPTVSFSNRLQATLGL